MARWTLRSERATWRLRLLALARVVGEWFRMVRKLLRYQRGAWRVMLVMVRGLSGRTSYPPATAEIGHSMNTVVEREVSSELALAPLLRF